MPAPVQTPRARWIEAGLAALMAGGVDRVRVELVASSLGVTKGGFYGHFAHRDEFLEALLDEWETTLVDQAIESADHGGGDGRTRLKRLFATADRMDQAESLELAIRDWARRDADVAARVARVDDRRMAYLRPLFADFCDDPADVEGRCLLVLTLFVGTSLVGARHGRRSRATATAAALRHLLR